MTNTVIELRHSYVTGNVPSSLANGEIAINTYDGRLFYRGGPSNTVQTIERYEGPAGLDGEIQFNSSGVLGSNPTLVFDESTNTLDVSNLYSFGTVTSFVNISSPIVIATDYFEFSDGSKQYTANAGSGGGGTDDYARETANAAFDTANSSFITANSAASYANGAFIRANNSLNANTGGTIDGDVTINGNLIVQNNSYFGNANLHEGITQLSVTNDGPSAYLFDQYPGSNPSLYVGAGETISFNLNVSGHPFVIRESSGGANTSAGLTHISTTGVVSTGAAAQGKESGVLFWKVPFSLVGSTYVYQCVIHGGMVGNIVIQQPASFVAANTTLVFNTANGAFIRANNSLNANTGGTIDGDVLITGNLIVSGNTTTISVSDLKVDDALIQLASNNETSDLLDIGFLGHYSDDSGVTKRHTGLFRDASDGLYYLFYNYEDLSFDTPFPNNTIDIANSSFRIANLTANLISDVITIRGVDPLTQANSAWNTANAAFNYANTLSSGTAEDGVAREIANSAASYANGAFIQANAAFEAANSGGGGASTDQYARDTANGAFIQANAAFEAANSGGGGSSTEIVNGNSNVTIAIAGSQVDVSVNGFINVVSFTSNTTVCNSHVNPIATNRWDLGSAARRWRNIYTNDLNLNNGIGDWTIVEGEDDLFLYNNKKNKVYKFALVEVDASEATPKIDGLK